MSLLAERSRVFAHTIRPQMAVLPFLLYAAVVIKHDGPHVSALVLGYALLVCAYGAVVAQNDIADAATDRLNKRRDIPLANGLITQLQLLRYIVALVVAGTLFAAALHHNALLWLTMYIVLGWLYSGPIGLKNNGYVSPVILGIGYGVMPLWLGALVSGGAVHPVVTAASFVFAATITLYKDFKDYAGDKSTGKRTLLVMHGPRVVQTVALVGAITAWTCLAIIAQPGVWLLIAIIGLGASIIILARGDILRSGTARGRLIGRLRTAFYAYMAAFILFGPHY